MARLRSLAPAAVLLSGLLTVLPGPFVAPVAASGPTGPVVAWGDNTHGQTSVPAGLSDVTAIAAGTNHALALQSDGTVVAWGDNTYGQTAVPAGLSGVTAISAGGYHSLALRSDGTVVGWGGSGDFDFGQATVPADLSGVIAISAGSFHSLALKSNGTVVAWGRNAEGQATVPADLSDLIAISAGGQYSLALKSNGTVVAWGDNTYHQTNVPAGLSNVTSISAGGYHGLALKSNGTVVAWGASGSLDFGQATVPADLSDVIAISGGGCHSLALKSDGTAVGWGAVGIFDLGQATIPAGLSGLTAISAGGYYSLALTTPTATHLIVVTANPFVAGSSHSVTVTAKGASGNTATGYVGTIHLTSSDPAAVLPADYTFIPAENGVHKFSTGFTLKTSGSRSVIATDTVTTSITGSQTITVNPGAARTLTVVTANPWVAGVAHTVTVTAKDAYGNVAAGYLGTVHLTSNDPAAILPADYAFVGADHGVYSFSGGLTLKTAGSRSVTAKDTVTASITGTQTITVNPGAARTLTVSTSTSFVAGAGHTLTITAKDAYGNTATGYVGTIHLTSTDGQAVLPANYTFVAGDLGVHRLTITLKTAGSRTVTATDTVTATIKGTQSGITVTPAAARTFTLVGAVPWLAGASHSVTVTARDNYGNVATAYVGTVHLTSSDSAAVLPADYTFVAGDAGVHKLTVKLKTVGSQWVRATDTHTATITGSVTITVS